MRRRWISVVCVLAAVCLLAVVAATAASSTLSGTRFKLGETIQFQVQDTTTWWWGCCAISESLILGWRIVDSTGQAVYSVVHDAPVAASLWQGTWLQMDTSQVRAVAAATAVASAEAEAEATAEATAEASAVASAQALAVSQSAAGAAAHATAAVGAYTLYVDTSVGTLSRCFTIYDPCTRCGWTPACRTCACNQVTSITGCASRTTLVFVNTSRSRCVSLFGWFGSCSSPCNPCTTCP